MSELEKFERNPWTDDLIDSEKIRHMRKILLCVAEYIAKGKSTSEIEKETKLHRDTVHSLGKELMKLGLVEKKGHFGNYRLTQKAFQNHIYVGQRLVGELLRHISFRNQYISLNNIFSCDALIQKFDYLTSQNPEFFNEKKNMDEMDAILIYEFSNRIGALITYLVIQAFQSTRESALNKEGTMTDKLVFDWLNNTIKPHFIIFEFLRFTNYARGHIYGKDILQRTKKSDKNFTNQASFYEIENKDYDNLNDAFARVYPDLYDLITNIRDSEVSKNKVIEERRKQYLCRPHTFTIETINEVKFFKCSKCGSPRTVMTSNIATNKELISRLNRESNVRMRLSSRKKCGHIWIRSTSHPDPTKNLFECICCLRWLTLPAESKEKLEKIDKAIRLRFRTQNDMLLLCKQVQSFFSNRSNEEHSFNTLAEYFKNKYPDLTGLRKRSDHDDIDTSTITNKLQSVVKFLVDLDFLSLMTSTLTKNDPESNIYIHKSLTNWRQ
jgi:hypothetical protein